MGCGIDGRKDMPSVFDGRKMDYPLTHLKQFGSDAVWLRYEV